MQRDYGLTRPRSAGDHGEALVRGPDRLILLGLDGGDDVPHCVITSASECGKQRPLANHDQLSVRALAVEEVVLDANHPIAPALQHSSPDDLHGIARGGTVERFRRGCAPVDDQWFVVSVANADTADIADFAVGAVQPAENQPFLLGIQHSQPSSGLVGKDVALEKASTVLFANVGVAVGLIEGEALSRNPLGGAGRLGEPSVNAIYVSLFGGQLAL